MRQLQIKINQELEVDKNTWRKLRSTERKSQIVESARAHGKCVVFQLLGRSPPPIDYTGKRTGQGSTSTHIRTSNERTTFYDVEYIHTVLYPQAVAQRVRPTAASKRYFLTTCILPISHLRMCQPLPPPCPSASISAKAQQVYSSRFDQHLGRHQPICDAPTETK